MTKLPGPAPAHPPGPGALAPISGAVTGVRTARLSDGTSVWLDPMRDVRSVALGIYVRGGSADERPDLLGSTHFLEHLLFKRTRRRSGPAIARMTDRLGGDCDAYTTKEYVAFHARTEASRLDDATDLLLDLTEAPVFTSADVETERDVILEEMAEAHDVPEDRLHDDLVRRLWPRHPLGAPIFGTNESVAALAQRKLVSRFREIFRPERTLVAAVGAFDADAFLARLERERGRRRRVAGRDAEPTIRRTPGKPPRSGGGAVHLLRPDLAQTHLMIGTATVPYGHPLVPAASLAVLVLGGGVSSRLWRSIREDAGLAYHVGAALSLFGEAGIALVEAASSPKNVRRLVRRVARVLSRARRDGLTRAELSRARNQIHAEVAMALESTSARRESVARAWLYRGRPYEADEYLADIDAVSLEDASRAIDHLFGGAERAVLGVAGPTPGTTVEALREELLA